MLEHVMKLDVVKETIRITYVGQFTLMYFQSELFPREIRRLGSNFNPVYVPLRMFLDPLQEKP